MHSSVHPGLGDQAFGSDADALVTVQYQAHRDALVFVHSVLRSSRGVGVLHGPASSGKTTIARRVRNSMPDGAAVAMLDGTDLRPRRMLSGILAEYGYNTGLQSTDELCQMVTVFAAQQAQSVQPPILIIDNFEHMYPSSLRILNSLAALKAKHKFAIRILLTGNDGLSELIGSKNLANIAERYVGTFMIGPMTARETMLYLHARLTARGIQQPYKMFPAELCIRLRKLSGGWPGYVNHHAQEAIRPGRPRLTLTRDGKTISHYTFSTKKALLGRSAFADVVLEDEFASKMHAVLLLYANALVLLDLNSSNGTTVNSVKVSSTVLKDDDIISISNHRIKVENAPAMSAEMMERLRAPDTVRMKSLADLRQLREDSYIEVADTEKQGGD